MTGILAGGGVFVYFSGTETTLCRLDELAFFGGHHHRRDYFFAEFIPVGAC
jgi:hypothetical protein